jgi:hypothetical protein
MPSEDIVSAYHAHGYAHLEALAPPQVAKGLLGFITRDLARPGVAQKLLHKPSVNTKPAYEFYSYQYPPVMGFHFGLTSRMCDVTGKRLLPTYGFFRVYQKDDICTVHSDRPSCEHSLSLALAYGDGIVWDFEIGSRRMDFDAACAIKAETTFGDEAFSRLKLNPGDAILYKGVNYRHGRITPNPNRWSAHLFLHWIDADGPFKEWAFDKQTLPEPGGFAFPA